MGFATARSRIWFPQKNDVVCCKCTVKTIWINAPAKSINVNVCQTQHSGMCVNEQKWIQLELTFPEGQKTCLQGSKKTGF